MKRLKLLLIVCVTTITLFGAMAFKKSDSSTETSLASIVRSENSPVFQTMGYAQVSCQYAVVYKKIDMKVTKPFEIKVGCNVGAYLKYAWSGYVWRSYLTYEGAYDAYKNLVNQGFGTVNFTVNSECACK